MKHIFIISGKKEAGKDTFVIRAKEVFKGKIRQYAYIDPMKQFCINVLGLRKEQCYGTNADKDTLTHLRWENQSIWTRWRNNHSRGASIQFVASPEKDTHIAPADEAKRREVIVRSCVSSEETFWKYALHGAEPDVYLDYKPALLTGQMTARQVMQVIGTEIGRLQISDDVWVIGTFRQIARDIASGEVDVAFITDARFPNELDTENVVSKVSELQGVTFTKIRLLRDIHKGEEVHDSEKALDDYPLNRFDYVIPDMHIDTYRELIPCILRDRLGEQQRTLVSSRPLDTKTSKRVIKALTSGYNDVNNLTAFRDHVLGLLQSSGQERSLE